jgi:hypothetical protein
MSTFAHILESRCPYDDWNYSEELLVISEKTKKNKKEGKNGV